MFQAPNTARVEASFRNYATANPTSFGSTVFDDWRLMAHGNATSFAGRITARDATGYGTEPVEDSFLARINGQQSPARLTGASGIIRTGAVP